MAPEAALDQQPHGHVLEERAAPEALVWCAWTLRLLHNCICLGMVLQAGRASQSGAASHGVRTLMCNILVSAARTRCSAGCDQQGVG